MAGEKKQQPDSQPRPAEDEAQKQREREGKVQPSQPSQSENIDDGA